MPKKQTVSKPKARPVSRVKVVNNRPGSSVAASLRPKRMGLLVILLCMVVGAGTLTWVKAATTSYSLWTTTTVPKTIADSDTQSVEVGMKFKTQYSGQITSMRFYKGPQNTGVHRGNLWSADGRKLASVVFTNETASGWQSAKFVKPVDISANTTYTVSYLAPNGHYSVNENYFSAARTNGPLSALKSGAEGGNGVYAYTGKSVFPRQTYKASNYWVDVVYSTSRFSPTPKPVAPTDLAATLSGTNATLTWKYSPSTGVIRYEVLRNGVVVKNDVAGQSWVDSGLNAGTVYSYQVRAVDGTGQVSDLSNTAKVTTAANPPANPPVTPPTTTPPPTTPPPAGGSTGSTTTCPLPKYPNPSCTGVPAGKSLSTVNGDYVVTTPGATVNQLHITGALLIKASNVTITNSQIDGYVSNDITGFPRNHFVITDSQVGVASSCNTYANGAIGVSNYTAQRVRVLNFPDGFRVAGSNTIIEDSYVTPCSKTASDHSDGLQVYGATGGTNIIIRHNTIDETHVTNGAANAAIFVPGDGARQGNDNVKVDLIADNLIAGGGYPFYVPGPGSPITITAVTGNKVVNNTWEYHPFGVECSYVGLSSGNAVVTYDFNTGMILSQVSPINDCD